MTCCFVQNQQPEADEASSASRRRIDDLSLSQYRETVDPKSPPIVLLAPSGSPHPLYAQWGWLAPSGTTVKRPDETTLWTQQGSGPLTIDQPLQLAFDTWKAAHWSPNPRDSYWPNGLGQLLLVCFVSLGIEFGVFAVLAVIQVSR